MSVYKRTWKCKDGKLGGGWYYKFMVSGEFVHAAAVNPDNPKQKARTKKEAEAFESIAHQRLVQGEEIFKKPKAKTTFADFVEEIYKPYSQANHRSHRQYLYYLKVLCEKFGKMTFDQISPFAIERFKIEQQERGVSGNTIRLYLACGSDVCRMAMGESVAMMNPFLQVAIPEIVTCAKRRLSRDEEVALLKACLDPEWMEAEDRREHLASAITIMIELGSRPLELFNLRVQDVDWDERLVKFISYKTGRRRRRRSQQPKERWVPVTARAWTELVNLKESAQTDRLYPYDSVKKAWKSVCKEAGVSGFWFRWLRDEAASRWADAGATPYEIAYLLGHSDVVQGQGSPSVTRMSMIYVKPMMERLREVMEAASQNICRNFVAMTKTAS